MLFRDVTPMTENRTSSPASSSTQQPPDGFDLKTEKGSPMTERI